MNINYTLVTNRYAYFNILYMNMTKEQKRSLGFWKTYTVKSVI